MEAASQTPAGVNRRPHRALVVALLVLGSIVAFLAVFSIWAKRQMLETDNWVDTSSQLLEDKEIREQLSLFMVDTLYANVDVQGELQKGLPPTLQGLSGPAAAGLHSLVEDLADKALQRPRVQEAWENINRTAHEKLIAVVEDNSSEPVTLDLSTILTQVGGEAGIKVADRLPEGAGEIVILPNDKLSGAQKAIDLIQKLVVVLTLLALFLFALAIYLAKGWRRVALRSVGFCFILVGLAVIVGRDVAGGAVVDSLASTASVEPAVQDTWDISTSLLNAGGGAMVFYGIMIVLGAWLAGPGGIATAARRAITPFMEQRGVGYAGLLLILLVLFWWSPTEGFHRLPIAILIIALFILGFEVLRSQAVREFPDETWEKGSERMRNAGQSLLDRRKS